MNTGCLPRIVHLDEQGNVPEQISSPRCSCPLSVTGQGGGGQQDSASAQSTIFACQCCTSALDVGWGLIDRGLMRPWDCLVAEDQTAGRGQLRRAWVSGRGNVYMALLLPDAISGNAAAVQAGWMLVKALRKVLEPYVSRQELAAIRLKWPNDLICGPYKFGGILLEERRGKLLAGIGINLQHSPGAEQLRPDFAFPAGNLINLLPDCGFVQNLSAQSLAVLLVTMLRFWYETEVMPLGEEIPPALMEPELAFLGEMVFVSDNTAGLKKTPEELLQACPEVCLGAGFGAGPAPVQGGVVGRLLGLGPAAELRLLTAKGEVLLTSGSVYGISETGRGAAEV